MKDVLAMVLAGGRVQELSVMTRERPKSAVPFGGQYLVIDFVMSNLMRSGVARVGILSQYRPSELIEHIGAGEPWDLWGRTRGAKILPPYQGTGGSDWYRGTADAVYQNLAFVERAGCEHVLVLSGDHVYAMDYGPLYEVHRAREADLTAVFQRIPGLRNGPARYGVAETNDAGRITGYEEKPDRARSDLASLTIFLFRREALVRHVKRNAARGKTFQLYDEVLPAMVAEGRTYCHEFDGYWAYTRTIDDYYAANMDFVADPPPIPFGDLPVRTNEEFVGLGVAPPAEIGPAAVVRRSRLAAGTRVCGRVEGSILSPGVSVAPGAVVRDSVLLAGCVVEEGARLERVVADTRVVLGRGSTVGGAGDAPPNVSRADILTCGATLLGPGVRVPEDAEIGRNCIIGRRARLTEGQVIVDGAAFDA